MKEPGRRRALKVLGSASLMPALSACSGGAPDKLVPYVVAPEDVIPGVDTFYATSCRECPAGCGMLARTRDGRVVKLEGNPEHPLSRGALCIRGQAAVQGLYDPDRIPGPLRRPRGGAAGAAGGGEKLSWDAGVKALAAAVRELRDAGRAERIALWTPLMSGSLDTFVDLWLGAIGGGKRVRYEPFGYEPIREAQRLLFGRDAVPDYDFAAARMILSFGADFLETWLQTVASAAGFREARRVKDGVRAEFVHVEARRSLTAASADTWLSVEPGTELFVALALAHVVLAEGQSRIPGKEQDALKRLLADHTPEAAARRAGVSAEEVRALARRFAAAQPGLAVGGGVAACGTNATATQVAIALLNYVTGNVGRTVRIAAGSAFSRAGRYRDALAQVEAMKRAEVELLLLHDVNPAFTLPRAAGFAEAVSRVKTVVGLGSHPDETAELASLLLPTHTPLESWGDHHAAAGVRSLQQPVMSPVFDTRHFGDLLLDVARELGGPVAAALPYENFLEYLKSEWTSLQQRAAPKQDFAGFWTQALKRGGLFEPAEPEPLSLRTSELVNLRFEPAQLEDAARPLTLVVHPSLHLYDGRGANKTWLQEIPETLSKASWSNWAELHPETCRALGVQAGQLIALETSHGRIDLPALPSDGVRPGVVAVPIGQGHTAYGRYAAGRGANPLRLLPAAPEAASGARVWLATRVTATALPVRRPLVLAQTGSDQAGRGMAQAVRLGSQPAAAAAAHQHASMYPEHEHPAHRWGMAIDVDACIGCNACVAACYAENNVPIVGPEPLRAGREMSWLRIERFLERDGGTSDVRFLPMLCQHCDHAPCEAVCPVYATYHNPEGLNAQIYNRCVGTRYCGNNCPYKVRRFNFFEHTVAAPLDRQLNPDVTVRSKGVMEKCTFCVQRIQLAKDHAKDAGRPLEDGEIVPACAQTCPTRAIQFGDLNDAGSRVSVLARDPRAYRVFEGLNTRPAITYLKKVLA
jgi:molybdopterin-containing oxidoreductase family iron-sulfur binding subunit